LRINGSKPRSFQEVVEGSVEPSGVQALKNPKPFEGC